MNSAAAAGHAKTVYVKELFTAQPERTSERLYLHILYQLSGRILLSLINRFAAPLCVNKSDAKTSRWLYGAAALLWGFIPLCACHLRLRLNFNDHACWIISVQIVSLQSWRIATCIGYIVKAEAFVWSKLGCFCFTVNILCCFWIRAIIVVWIILGQDQHRYFRYFRES